MNSKSKSRANVIPIPRNQQKNVKNWVDLYIAYTAQAYFLRLITLIHNTLNRSIICIELRWWLMFRLSHASVIIFRLTFTRAYYLLSGLTHLLSKNHLSDFASSLFVFVSSTQHSQWIFGYPLTVAMLNQNQTTAVLLSMIISIWTHLNTVWTSVWFLQYDPKLTRSVVVKLVVIQRNQLLSRKLNSRWIDDETEELKRGRQKKNWQNLIYNRQARLHNAIRFSQVWSSLIWFNPTKPIVST